MFELNSSTDTFFGGSEEGVVSVAFFTPPVFV